MDWLVVLCAGLSSAGLLQQALCGLCDVFRSIEAFAEHEAIGRPLAPLHMFDPIRRWTLPRMRVLDLCSDFPLRVSGMESGGLVGDRQLSAHWHIMSIFGSFIYFEDMKWCICVRMDSESSWLCSWEVTKKCVRLDWKL